MTRLDEVQAEIAFEKQVFFLLFVAGLACVGWVFTNVTRAEAVQVYVAVGAIVADGIALAILARRVKNKIKTLKDL